MRITRSKQFEKQYKKLGKKLQKQVQERIELFIKDQFHPLLENHRLHGEYSTFRSINITGDYRLIFESVNEEEIHLALIGTHSELYKS